MTKEDKVRHDELAAKKAELIAEREELLRELEDYPTYEYRDFVEDDLRHTEQMIEMISRVVRD